MIKEEYKQILNCQLAADYCCSEKQAAAREHIFSYYEAREGRRRFMEQEDCFFKVACVHGKLLVTGQKEIVDWCKDTYANVDAAWFMEYKNLQVLNEKLKEYGYRIGQAHPFYIATEQTKMTEEQIAWYIDEEIEQFRGDNRFREAYSFCEAAPDRIGVSYTEKGEILGMAGASADSPQMWQIGIDVVPKARGRHIGEMLVTLLKNRLLSEGILPYYGTAMSHIASQNVAIASGFYAGWAELYAERIV